MGVMPNLTVLLVEDNPGDALLIEEMIADRGRDTVRLQLRTATDLRAGIDAARGTQLDAVFLDLSLPDSHGLETLDRFRETAHDLPVIVLTGWDDADIAAEAMRRGAQDYLVKGSFDASLLRRSVRYAVERAAGERERRLLESRLRHAERLDSVGRLAGAVAHDFNNLLTTIVNNLEFARKEGPLTAAQRADIDTALGAADSAAGLVRQIVQLSQWGEEPATMLLIDCAIREICVDLHDRWGSRHPLLVRGQCAASVAIMPDELQRVLHNLSENAYEAMPNGGTIIVEVADVRPGPSSAAGVRISVTDDGTGMNADTVQKIFDMYFSTKPDAQRVGSGLGFGLAVAHAIVTARGGYIDVTSTPGHGSRFDVILPAA